VEPLIGHVKVGNLDADVIDSFYAELRRCRVHCSGKARRQLDHRTKRPHTCDDRCQPHECKPLCASSIRQIHFILSGAYKRASPRELTRAIRTNSNRYWPELFDGSACLALTSIRTN
jgi:hypothetical protein